MKYPVVCICGSTRFKKEFREMEEKLALRGYCVLSISVWSLRKKLHDPQDEESIRIKTMLDDVYKQAIDMSDFIYVINKGGYIGKSTGNEIEYAELKGKQVVYLESI